MNACLRLESLEARDLLSRYLVTDLGDFAARAINQAGAIAGDVNGVPALWEHGERITLPMPDGYLIAIPEALNDSGTIVGYGVDADFTAHALRWDATGVTDLGGFGTHAYADGVNNSGMIAGWSDIDPGTAHPVMWPPSGGATDLEPDAGATADFAYAINDAGQIVGTYHAQAFRWQDGVFQVLDSPFGIAAGQGLAIDSRGDVAGSAAYYESFGTVYSRPAVWTADGGFIDLGLLPNTAQGRAIGMNDGGDVVGSVGTPTTSVGFLWHDGVLHDLSSLVRTPSYTIVGASAITNAGQILAAGRPDGGGAFHSLLLTPTAALQPELGWALMLVRQHSP